MDFLLLDKDLVEFVRTELKEIRGDKLIKYLWNGDTGVLET
jgi:hypothetical protein